MKFKAFEIKNTQF